MKRDTWINAQRLLGMIAFLVIASCHPVAVWAQADAVRTNAASDLNEFLSSAGIWKVSVNIEQGSSNHLQVSPRQYVPAGVRLADQLWANVGVRLHGKGSFQPIDRKPSLSLKWNTFVPNQSTQGVTKVFLHNGGTDRSLLRDFLATSILQDAGVPSARVGHARVLLNGRDLGFYSVIEAMNKPFLRRVFGNDTGNLYEGDLMDIDSELEQDNGKVKDQTDLQLLCAISRIPDPAERWRRLPEVLDVDAFVSFVALGRLMGHDDSYVGRRINYRIYHNPATDKMVFVHHGLKGTFREVDSAPLMPLVNSIAVRAVLKTWPGRKLYRERLSQLFTNFYNVDVLTNRIHVELARMLLEARSVEESAELKSEASMLCDIVAVNARHIAEELGKPELEVPQFGANGAATVVGWQFREARNAVLDQMPSDGRGSLHIRIAEGNRVTTAAWRTRVVLEPGKYRFSGACRTLGMRPGEMDPAIGAGLFLTARPGNRGRYCGGDWKELVARIEVQDGPQEVWLQCELKATQGEAWFDTGSLLLIKE